MRIWHSTSPGGAETLELQTTASPEPGPGEVRIDIAACGINFPDSLIIRDQYQFKPDRPFAPGAEVAGKISALGSGVERLSIGDRVVARSGWGGLAEQLVIDAERCSVMPGSMPYEEGAALLFTYATSYHALKQRARIAAGETLLVLGAAGGTGAAAIELAKAMGARVIAATSSAEKAEFARSCGADGVVVYPSSPLDRDAARALGEDFKAALGPGGADIVYDPVGGDYAEPALRSIAWKGRYLVVGFTAGIPRLPFNLPLLKGCEIVGVFNGGFLANEPDLAAQNIRELLSLYEIGSIKPRVSRVFAFEEAPAAIAAIARRQAMGKFVVRIGSIA